MTVAARFCSRKRTMSEESPCALRFAHNPCNSTASFNRRARSVIVMIATMRYHHRWRIRAVLSHSRRSAARITRPNLMYTCVLYG